ncbi:hypothetical protein A4H96_04980 [Acidithiobacillus ferrooxidans]|uniref:Uncharacterized protein n=1 Tax=Acidithiobacillus ferrooxidans TaxID=920 RepID=A0A179BLP2_ACIFR|nr:hypothetical protein A4H96_04980 [Acidithiobacillus ferrooxidans]
MLDAFRAKLEHKMAERQVIQKILFFIISYQTCDLLQIFLADFFLVILYKFFVKLLNIVVTTYPFDLCVFYNCFTDKTKLFAVIVLEFY